MDPKTKKGWSDMPDLVEKTSEAPTTDPTAGAVESRAGAVCGLLMTLLWAPMAFVIPRFPDLGSPAAVATFWEANMTLMQVVIVSVSIGFVFLLGFLGTLTARLRRFEASGAGTYAAFGAALMFFTALNVAIGLDAAGGLVLGTAGPDATYLLHAAGFVLAAPAAFAGVGFFACLTYLTETTGVFPRWLGWLAAVGVLANVGAVAGATTLTGPLNAGNGAIAGIAAPLGLFVIWTAAVSLWWLSTARPRQRRRHAPHVIPEQQL